VPEYVAVSAPLATPVLNGRSLRPYHPRTEIWALLYAQVMQIDGASRRNILINRARADPEIANSDQRYADQRVQHALTRFGQDTIVANLIALGLPPDSPLSVMAIEGYRGALASSDPLGIDLGQVRILRASNLIRVPEICIPA
jgi:hypothetical protein